MALFVHSGNTYRVTAEEVYEFSKEDHPVLKKTGEFTPVVEDLPTTSMIGGVSVGSFMGIMAVPSRTFSSPDQAIDFGIEFIKANIPKQPLLTHKQVVRMSTGELGIVVQLTPGGTSAHVQFTGKTAEVQRDDLLVIPY